MKMVLLSAGDMGSTIVGTYGYMAPEQFTGQVRCGGGGSLWAQQWSAYFSIESSCCVCSHQACASIKPYLATCAAPVCVRVYLQATPASDLYSLGATLLYLVSGQPPGAFPQTRMRIAYK